MNMKKNVEVGGMRRETIVTKTSIRFVTVPCFKIVEEEEVI